MAKIVKSEFPLVAALGGTETCFHWGPIQVAYRATYHGKEGSNVMLHKLLHTPQPLPPKARELWHPRHLIR